MLKFNYTHVNSLLLKRGLWQSSQAAVGLSNSHQGSGWPTDSLLVNQPGCSSARPCSSSAETLKAKTSECKIEVVRWRVFIDGLTGASSLEVVCGCVASALCAGVWELPLGTALGGASLLRQHCECTGRSEYLNKIVPASLTQPFKPVSQLNIKIVPYVLATYSATGGCKLPSVKQYILSFFKDDLIASSCVLICN